MVGHSRGALALEAGDITFAAHPTVGKPLAAPLTFDVPSGTVTLVSGPSGCGKSTLLNVLVGIHPLMSGEVTLFGDVAVSRLGQSARQKLLRSRIAYVGQDLHAFPGLTVSNYLEFNQRISGDAHDRDRSQRLLSSLGVGGLEDRPLGALSKGQLQRVLVCGGLIRPADLILLDEPTSALDTDSRDALLGLLDARVSEGASVIMVSHDPALRDRIERQVSMTGGGSDV